MGQCKNICESYNIYPITGHVQNQPPLPKCRNCAIKIEWDGNFCPCCNTRLSRTNKTNADSKPNIKRIA